MYVPVVQRAAVLWRELEERTGRRLMFTTGGLMMGPADGEVVTGTLRAAAEWTMPHEVLTPADLPRRFPAFRLAEGELAILDPRAGWLAPEDCVEAHLSVARSHGATITFDEPVISWEADAGGVRVTTSRDTYLADQLVVTVGARTTALVPELELPLTIERQVLHWFDPDRADRSYDADRFPIFAYEHAPGGFVYGFPRLARGVKAAVMHEGEIVADADRVRRTIEPGEARPLRDALARVVPVSPARRSEKAASASSRTRPTTTS